MARINQIPRRFPFGDHGRSSEIRGNKPTSATRLCRAKSAGVNLSFLGEGEVSDWIVEDTPGDPGETREILTV